MAFRPACGLLLGLALTVAAAPSAEAQGGATSSLAIDGLPAASASNRSVALLPFNVTYSLEGLVCVGGALTVTVELGARVRQGNATARASPPQMFFTAEQLDHAQGGYSGTQEGLLVVERPGADAEGAWAGGEGNATVRVVADVTYFSGCGVLNVPGDEASAETTVQFRSAGASPGRASPAAAALALPLGLASLAALLRRHA